MLTSLVVAVPAAEAQVTTSHDLCDSQGEAQFSDVADGSYGAAYILCMKVLDLTTGYGDGSYGPNNTLTRAQMASFLVRLWRDELGRRCPDGEHPFTDVTSGGVHDANIACIYTLGVTKGSTATTYGPATKLSPSQIARFMLRLWLKLKGDGVCPANADELARAIACLSAINVVPAGSEARSSSPASRAQMAVYLIGLWHNAAGRGKPPAPPAKRLANPPPPELQPVAASTPEDPYAQDPLRLIAHAELARAYSLGNDVWEVWLCKTPAGVSFSEHPDNKHNPANYATAFDARVGYWFGWLSDDAYRPEFIPGRVISVGKSSDYYEACRAELMRHAASRGSNGALLVLGDTTGTESTLGRGWCGYYSQREFPANGRTAIVHAGAHTDPSTVAHELGHALCWPHSYTDDGSDFPYANGMDVMSGGGREADVRTPITVGTPVVNRYAAGWVAPEAVRIHTTAAPSRYALSAIGDGGVQMLVVNHPGNDPNSGAFYALGVRSKGSGGEWWADADIPQEGIEVYWVDQTVRACDLPDRGACHGLDRRVESLGPGGSIVISETGTVSWTNGDAHRITVVERRGDIWVVDVAFTEGSGTGGEGTGGDWNPFMPEDEFGTDIGAGIWLQARTTESWPENELPGLSVRCRNEPGSTPDFDVFVWWRGGYLLLDEDHTVSYRFASTNRRTSEQWGGSTDNTALFHPNPRKWARLLQEHSDDQLSLKIYAGTSQNHIGTAVFDLTGAHAAVGPVLTECGITNGDGTAGDWIPFAPEDEFGNDIGAGTWLQARTTESWPENELPELSVRCWNEPGSTPEFDVFVWWSGGHLLLDEDHTVSYRFASTNRRTSEQWGGSTDNTALFHPNPRKWARLLQEHSDDQLSLKIYAGTSQNHIGTAVFDLTGAHTALRPVLTECGITT